MIDRICALAAVIVFAGFFSILIYSVPRLDLAVVVLFVCGLVGYDLWRQLFARRRRS